MVQREPDAQWRHLHFGATAAAAVAAALVIAHVAGIVLTK